MTKDNIGIPGEIDLPAPLGEIPRKLKAYYDALQEEVIPERFLDLLERLDQAERASMAPSGVEEQKR